MVAVVEDAMLVGARGLIDLNGMAPDLLLRLGLGGSSSSSESDESSSADEAPGVESPNNDGGGLPMGGRKSCESMVILPNLFKRGVLILEPGVPSEPGSMNGEK